MFRLTSNRPGFTIVELLIVIVVIAVLAAITVVAYNGIQSRAKTSAAQSAANIFAKKAEAFSSDGTTSTYPVASTDLTGASSGSTFYLSGATVSGTALASAPTPPSTLNFYRCGTNTTAAATSLLTTTVVTGGQVRYWNHQTGSTANLNFGQTSGVAPNTYGVTCYLGT